MDTPTTLVWDTEEYQFKERSKDWFWGLGLTAVAICGIAIYAGNYFFAVFIIVAAFAVGFFSIREPQMVHIELSKEGVRINDEFLPYRIIKSFYITPMRPNGVQELLLTTTRGLLPITTLPIHENDPEVIQAFLLQYLPEEVQEETPMQRLLDGIGL